MRETTKYKLLFLSLNIVLIVALLIIFVYKTNAAPLGAVLVRFDRMKASIATTGTICAKPTTLGTEADVQVTFPAGYSVSPITGNWTVNTTNLAWPTGGTAWPGIGTATYAAGQVVTFPSTDLTVGTLYCFNWANSAAVSTGTVGNSQLGTIATHTSVPITIDTATYAVAVIANDQIVVSANISPTFNFALSNNLDALGALTTGSVFVSPSPSIVTINTNAQNGWQAWIQDNNNGLTSASASYIIPSTTPGTNSTLVAGVQGYNMGVTSSQIGGSGTITVAAPFVGGATGKGGGPDSTLQSIAISTGSADNAQLTLIINAAISSTTEAATDYTDTITVIAAGLF